MTKIFFSKKGFTLLELLVVVGIIGIIAGVSWTLMSRLKKTADVQNTCEQVASMINKTRNYALSGKTVGVTVPSSFRISILGSLARISSIVPNNNNLETFNFTGGVSCTVGTYSFATPYGECSGCADTTCSLAGGGSRTVTVTPNSAVCN